VKRFEETHDNSSVVVPASTRSTWPHISLLVLRAGLFQRGGAHDPAGIHLEVGRIYSKIIAVRKPRRRKCL
jgi:hypothetical protein